MRSTMKAKRRMIDGMRSAIKTQKGNGTGLFRIRIRLEARMITTARILAVSALKSSAIPKTTMDRNKLGTTQPAMLMESTSASVNELSKKRRRTPRVIKNPHRMIKSTANAAEACPVNAERPSAHGFIYG